MNYLEKALAFLAKQDTDPPETAAPAQAPEPPSPPGSPPCEHGQRCDLDGAARYCREHCRPGYAADALRPHPPEGWRVLPGGRAEAEVDGVRVTLTTGRPAWRAEVDAWPADFREAWADLAACHERAGLHRAAAAYLSFEDLKTGAQEAAERDRRETKEDAP